MAQLSFLDYTTFIPFWPLYGHSISPHSDALYLLGSSCFVIPTRFLFFFVCINELETFHFILIKIRSVVARFTCPMQNDVCAVAPRPSKLRDLCEGHFQSGKVVLFSMTIFWFQYLRRLSLCT
jgi:hypothetical protein